MCCNHDYLKKSIYICILLLTWVFHLELAQAFGQGQYLLKTLKGYSKGVKVVEFEPTGKTLLGASKNEFRIWSSQGTPLHQKKPGEFSPIRRESSGSVLLGKNELIDATYNEGLVVFLWKYGRYDGNIRTYAMCLFWHIHADEIETLFEERIRESEESGLTSIDAVATNHKKNLIAIALTHTEVLRHANYNSYEHKPSIRIYDLSSRREIRRLDGIPPHRPLPLHARSGVIRSVEFSRSGNYLAAASKYKYVALWGTHSWNEVWYRGRHSKTITSISFSQDGKTLATGSDDKSILLLNASNGSVVRRFLGHKNDVRSVAISPDGNYIASGSKDKTVRIWRLHTGKEILVLKGHKKGVNSVAFSPDGNILASGSDDKTIKLWDFRKIIGNYEAEQRRIAEAKAEEERRRKAMPSDLQLTASFSDDTSFFPNNILDGGESAQLNIGVNNNGKGIGFGVTLNLTSNDSFIKVRKEKALGEIAPGESQSIQILISADLDAPDGTVTVTVQAKEKRGYDSRPVQIVIPVRHLDKPRLTITSYTINDGKSGLANGNGNGIPENNETIELEVFVKNQGVGTSLSTELKLASINPGIEVLQRSVAMGDILPNQTRSGKLAFQIPRTFASNQLNFDLAVEDKIGASKVRQSYWEAMHQRIPVLAYNWRVLDTREVKVDEVTNGATFILEITSRNEGAIAATGVDLQVRTSSQAHIEGGQKNIGRLEAGTSGTPVRIYFNLPRTVQDSSLPLNLTLNQADFTGISEDVQIPVRLRVPRLHVNVTLVTSNGDAVIEQGENVELTCLIRNAGDLAAEDVRFVLSGLQNNPGIYFQDGEKRLGTLPPGESQAEKFSFFVKNSTGPGPLTATLKVKQGDAFPGVEKQLDFEINMAAPEVVRVKGKEAEVATKRFVPPPTSQPPAVFVLVPGGGRVFENNVKLEIHVQDDKPLLGVKPEIRVNGILVSERLGLRGIGLEERQAVKSNSEVTFHRMVELQEGENMVSVTVRDSDNEISKKDITVTYLTKRTDVWALVVGVRQYQNSSLNLNYTDRDATAFYDFLRSPAGGQVPKENIILLLNEKATQANILGKLNETLRKAAENDLAILYFALHGMPDENGNELYFLGYDADSKNLLGTAVPKILIDQQLAQAARKNKVVMFVDACHSGSFGLPPTLAMRGAGRASVTNRLLAKIAEAQNGLAILTASSASEFSREDVKWGGGHGVFTHYLLEGLTGEADRDGNKYVTIQEAAEYVKRKVRQATNGNQNPELVDRGYDRDLPLAVVR